MSDRNMMWSVWITGVFLILFACVVVQVSSQGLKANAIISGQKQKELDKHVEVLRMQMLQLEKVNSRKLRR